MNYAITVQWLVFRIIKVPMDYSMPKHIKKSIFQVLAMFMIFNSN